MSKLTWNLLHAIDYDRIKEIRLKNFEYLSGKLGNLNRLKLSNATFMYPLLVENGSEIRKRLQTNKIYIPTLWPAVFELTSTEDLENDMASNILPLPIDQRYCIDDMQYMVEAIKRYGEL